MFRSEVAGQRDVGLWGPHEMPWPSGSLLLAFRALGGSGVCHMAATGHMWLLSTWNVADPNRDVL